MLKLILLPIRVLVFLIGWLFYFLETSADWIIGVRGKTEYIRNGACNRCGRCCRLLALEVRETWLKRKWLKTILILIHSVFFNFEYQGQEKNWVVYRCRYLIDGEEPRCQIYYFRHRICRFFPHADLFGHPKLHNDCGFWFKRRDGKPTFDEILKIKKQEIRHG